MDSTVTLELELRDSLDLDFLGSPILASTNPEGSRFAFFDYPSKKIIISDKSGKILDTLSKNGDTPDSYGFLIDLPVIWGNDQLIQVGMNGIFIYNQDGNMLKKIKHPEDMGGAAFMSIPGKTSKIALFDNVPYLLMNSIRTKDTYAGEQKFYDTYKALELVNLETGESKDFGSFEKGSLFHNGKGFIQSDYLPAFAESKGKLYLSHGGEPKVWIYDFTPEKSTLDTTLALDIPNLFPIEGVDRKELSKGSYSIHGGNAAIKNIFVQKGKILIFYFPGLDPREMEEAQKLWSEGKEEESSAFYEKLQKKSPPGILVYDESSLEYLGQLKYPQNTNTGGFLTDGEYIYFQRIPPEDIEEDFLRIYKMKLVEK
ncbi:hypothetical protein J2X69_004567 [Algoriphagus sp. 4150]|uniref:hypothetical protein n=1 Tax=Algoriphagus sp. 4150 TaxID=2817756 RepID=UPI002865A497|nr:hypothetical protein [Algoriphagus sp. 4150]MDR7132200.1 hypothetical protein [Algoriphagus sp. 4150]